VTRIKEQVIEMLQEIPDDKVIHILEIMKGLKSLYGNDKTNIMLNESEHKAMGILKKYANPDLISKEKEAWGEAVKEKHGNH
jgi:predicted house-cleaning noncanonical NTP pyrophosphatase (MazG superfamily)